VPTTNQDRVIVTMASGHWAVHVSPDICNLPGGADQAFPNYVSSALLVGGTTSVSINGAPIWHAPAQLGPPSEPAHAGTDGGVVSGVYRGEARATSWSADVIIEGHGAVRTDDTTTQNHGNTDGIVVGLEGLCRALWEFYDQEAEDIVSPFDGDPRVRNHVITGAYANLFQQFPDFAWAGLAIYGSKGAGCGMDAAHQTKMPGIGDPGGVVSFLGDLVGQLPGWEWKDVLGDYVSDEFALGNRDLFVDAYPMHRFFMDNGWDMFSQCAESRVPPVPHDEAYWSFQRLNDYLASGRTDQQALVDHVVGFAYQEQQNTLQPLIFDDAAFADMLAWSQSDAPAGSIPEWLANANRQPMQIVFSTECTGDHSVVFDGDQPALLEQRMDWVVNDLAPEYLDNHIYSEDHYSDAEDKEEYGESFGAVYPSGAPSYPDDGDTP
jgi:uncharacterized protein DUF2515/uncharacterized protein DUF4150